MTIETKNRILTSIRVLEREERKAKMLNMDWIANAISSSISSYKFELRESGYNIEKPVTDPVFKNINDFKAIHAYSGKKYVNENYPFITRNDLVDYYTNVEKKDLNFIKNQLRSSSDRMIGRLLSLGYIEQYANGWMYIKEV